jgi:transcriptional regulator of met regulon
MNNYRTKLHEEINLHTSLKSCTKLEEATNNFISLLQESAQQTTPTLVYKKDVVNIPLEIEKLLTEKRKVRATWQRRHTPSDKTTINRLSNHLKSKLQAMRANSLKNYVPTLSRYNNSIWKPIKSTRKLTLASPPLR